MPNNASSVCTNYQAKSTIVSTCGNSGNLSCAAPILAPSATPSATSNTYTCDPSTSPNGCEGLPK